MPAIFGPEGPGRIDISRLMSRGTQDVMGAAARFAAGRGDSDVDALHVLRVMAEQGPVKSLIEEMPRFQASENRLEALLVLRETEARLGLVMHDDQIQGVVYEQVFEIAQPTGRYVLHAPQWYGSVAEVLVGGKSAGHFVSRPWEVDVTDCLHAGRNAIQLRVVGTLKNTLGPHHGKPVLGKAWPWDFRQAPPAGPPAGETYHTVGYGLFEAPVLKQSK